MNELFRRQYGMPPSVLREKFATKSAAQCGDITVSLGYRPPYRWNEIVNFLAARVIPGIEKVTDNSYQRAVRLKNAEGKAFTGAVKVAQAAKKHALSVALSDSLIPVLPQVLAWVRRLFDLCCDPDLIYEKLRCMDDRRPGLCINGIRAAGGFDSFETAACAVLGQQITVKAAGTLAGRVAECFGVPVNTGVEGLNRVFPSADDIFALGDGVRKSFGTLGIISARSESIRSLASAIVHGKIDLEHPASPEEEIKKLMKIRGIGGWTAQYIAMRTMEYGVRRSFFCITAWNISRRSDR